MKVCFELAAAVREKAGVSRWQFESDKKRLTVLEAMIKLESAFSKKELRITEGNRVRKDVLVFMKDQKGKQKKIVDPDKTGYDTGAVILIATAMGGG